MTLHKLIAMLFGSWTPTPVPVAATTPRIEGMEARRLMAFTGGVRVAVADVNGDAPAVEQGLTCRKAGGSQQEYLQIKLENVMVTSYQ